MIIVVSSEIVQCQPFHKEANTYCLSLHATTPPNKNYKVIMAGPKKETWLQVIIDCYDVTFMIFSNWKIIKLKTNPYQSFEWNIFEFQLWVIDAFKRKDANCVWKWSWHCSIDKQPCRLGRCTWKLIPFDPKEGALLTQFQKHKKSNL